jgi:hypothetical protein
MTESEWLACTDPKPMLEFLRGKVSARKMQLFACACCRRIWDRLTDQKSRRAVELAEEFADGLIRVKGMSAAARAAYRSDLAGQVAWLTARLCVAEAWTSFPPDGDQVAGAAEVAASAARVRGSGAAESQAQATLLRDVVPAPSRQQSPPLSWLAWDGGMLPRLALSIHEERAFDRLPILADALEDAGCTDLDILDHCRRPEPHVRGCWVVDLILGKE